MAHNPDGSRSSISDLLAHEPFVRSLARRLVQDPVVAEDLAQETWLRAMRSLPPDVKSPRSWLATVVRNLAAKSYRRRQTVSFEEYEEGHAPRPSTADVAEARNVRQHLKLAIAELNDAQRSVITMTLLDNMSHVEIAERLELPVETVRTRYKRGIAKLREQLQAEYGTDRTLRGLLILAGLSLGGGAGIDVRVSGSKLAAMIVLPIVAASAVIWAVLATSGPSETLVAGNESVQEGPSGPIELAGADQEPVAPRRRSAQYFASLQITVLDANRLPVDSSRVRVTNAVTGMAQMETLTTDENGTAFLAQLEPGTVVIAPERGRRIYRPIAVGEAAEVEIVLPAGRKAFGTVYDKFQEPVEAADIWLSLPGDPVHGRVVAQTDALGKFALHNVAPECWLTAFHPATAGSKALYLDDPVLQDEERELAIRFKSNANQLRGSVYDKDGPVQGAEIYARTGGEYFPTIMLDGSLEFSPPPRRTLTDETGAFVVEGVRDLSYEVTITAPGRAPWFGSMIGVQDGVVREIHLERSASIAGVVRAPNGDLAPYASVEARLDGYDFSRRTVCDRSGAFRLDDLPPASFNLISSLQAADHDFACRQTVEVQSGEELILNLDLQAGTSLRGRARTQAGEPLGGWLVLATEQADFRQTSLASLFRGLSKSVRTLTDADGRFRLNVRPGLYAVYVVRSDDPYETPHAGASGVDPQAGEIELVVVPEQAPTASLSGTLLGSDGKPIPGARLAICTERTPKMRVIPVRASDGYYEAQGLPPRSFELSSWTPPSTLIALVRGELVSGAHLAVEPIEIPTPGELLVKASFPDGSELPVLVVRLYRSNATSFACSNMNPIPGFEFSGPDRARLFPLVPDTYRIQVLSVLPQDTSTSVATPLREVTVEAGSSQTLEFELRPTLSRMVMFQCPSLGDERVLRAKILADGGETVDSYDKLLSKNRPQDVPRPIQLEPGTYVIQARIDGWKEVEQVFELSVENTDPIVVDLRTPPETDE
jgi:RNA polymerase sigma-70 factor (ECF subfamily)